MWWVSHQQSQGQGGVTAAQSMRMVKRWRGREMLAQAAQKWCGCPIAANIQGQGEGSEQSDPDEDVPAGCRVVGPEGIENVPPIPHHSVVPWLRKLGCRQGTGPEFGTRPHCPCAAGRWHVPQTGIPAMIPAVGHTWDGLG